MSRPRRNINGILVYRGKNCISRDKIQYKSKSFVRDACLCVCAIEISCEFILKWHAISLT